MEITDRALTTIERVLLGAVKWATTGLLARLAVIGLFAVVLLMPGLTSLPVTDRDEARFAQASKQMMETGDLIDIRFQDKPRWKKPAGIYWLQTGAALPFGGAEAPIWAYRLPSLAGAALAAILLGWALIPALGQRGAALAGLMLAGTILVAAEANIAKTDAMLLATAVIALGGFLRLLPEAEPPGWPLAMAIWAALGAAILLKGPIVPVILILAAIALWLAGRRRPPLARLKPLPGMLVMLGLAAPWLIAIWLISDGAFFAESVGKDLMGKVAQGQEKHWGPPGLYLLLVWITLWPWAPLLVPAASWVRRHWTSPPVLALLAWVVPFWIVLEAVPTKLPHYVLPLYPALIGLIVLWAMAEDRTAPGPSLRRANALLLAVPGAGILFACLALPLWLEGAVPIPVLVNVPLAGLALALGIIAALRDRPVAQIGASMLTAALVFATVLGHALPSLQAVFPSPRIAAIAEPWRACASGGLVSGGYREPSLVFHAGTDTRLPSPPEVARILRDEPGALVFVEDRWMRHLERAWGGPGPELIARGQLTYFNYNRGSMETARLVTRDDPRWAPCAAAAEAPPGG